ncbi:uncharacterized protein [Antedon mediterranea]|uniref:uncharacterized protein n=1 Tax=Antedon mediterranea TaxID=105859 RepID=UPI003AF44D3A
MAKETQENEKMLEHSLEKDQQKTDTIFDACKGGDGNLSRLEKMISDKVDVNQKKENGDTPLGIAVCSGDLYTMNALINAGADVELSDNQLMTPLMLAAQLGFDSKLGFLLKNGANPMAIDKSGQTALHKTVRNKTTKCASVLIDHWSELVHAEDRMDQTALHFAAGEGNNELIDLLIGHGAKIGLVDRLGRAPLHWAILQGMDESAKKIGEQGEPEALDRQDKLGMCPIHYALQQSNDSISTNLIKQGCDVDALDVRGQSGLAYASSNGRTDMCGLILDNSKNKNSVDSKGWTALHHAARKNHANICHFLLEHGLDGGVKNDEGHTALVVAVINESMETVKTLCEKMDGWPLVADDKGRYPIHYAAERGHHDIMELLINELKRKCDSEPIMKTVLSSQDSVGASPLQMAAILNFKACCQLLLDNGVNIEDNVRPHLVRMELIEDTRKEEKVQENKEKEKEDEKEVMMTPMERYAPPTSPSSTSSSDDIKSMSLSELLDDKSALSNTNPPPQSVRLARRKENERNQSNGQEREKKNRKDNKSKYGKRQGRKSPYTESLLPPEILAKYAIGYLPPPIESRLSGRLKSSDSNRATENTEDDEQRRCRLKGTLDESSGRQTNASSKRPHIKWRYSYSVKYK